MEEKDLLKVMLTGFWLTIQTGSSLWQGSSWGLRQARSLRQKAWSRLTRADVARSAVNCSPGARAGCFGPVSGLSMSYAAKGGKVHYCRCSCSPFRRQELLLLSALAKEWDDVLLGCRWPQGCGFLSPERNLLA